MNPTGKNGSDFSICWDCKNSTKPHICPWARDFTPVKGWKAAPTKIKAFGGGIIDTYIVRECPLFSRDSFGGGKVENTFTGKTEHIEIDDDDLKTLACAIIERYVEDWKQLDYGRLRDLCIGSERVYRDHVLKFFASQWFYDLLQIAAPDYEPPEIWKALRIQRSMLEGVKFDEKPVGRFDRK